jgi:hypothetical protein
MRDEPTEEREVRLDSAHLGLAERGRKGVEGLGPRFFVGDQLGDQGVVRDWDLVTLLDPRVDADVLGEPQVRDRAGPRQEAAGVLGVEPCLDCVTLWLPRFEREPLARCDVELLLYEVEARDELGDRMLDLDPGVQLEEEEVAVGQHELGCTGALVAHGARERDCGGAHLVAEIGANGGRRALLEDLLVPSLHGAVALAEVHNGSLAVSEELDLDVPRALDVALAEDAVVAEPRSRLAAG